MKDLDTEEHGFLLALVVFRAANGLRCIWFLVAFNRVGRDTQTSRIWKTLLTCNDDSPTKPEVLYLHDSPGLGKTYLLRTLFLLEGVSSEVTRQAEAVKFLVLDFGMDGCNQALKFKDDFEEYPGLFALSRLYYVTFAVQSELTWLRFIPDAVVPLILA